MFAVYIPCHCSVSSQTSCTTPRPFVNYLSVQAQIKLGKWKHAPVIGMLVLLKLTAIGPRTSRWNVLSFRAEAFARRRMKHKRGALLCCMLFQWLQLCSLFFSKLVIFVFLPKVLQLFLVGGTPLDSCMFSLRR